MKRWTVKVLAIMFTSAVILTPAGVYAESMEKVESEVQSVASDGDEIIANDENGIPDVNFYKIVLQEGDANRDGILTMREAERIRGIIANNAEISSIEGIQFLTGLRYLQLNGNQISDIEPISDLNITDLELRNNQISDIRALANLSLNKLDITFNKITELDSLKNSKLAKHLAEYAVESTGTEKIAEYCHAGSVRKEIVIAEGNQISIENVLNALPAELLNYKLSEYCSDTKEYKLTGLTWLQTEAFYSEENYGKPILNDESGIPDEFFYKSLLAQYDYNKDGILTIDEAEITKSISILNNDKDKIEDIQGIQYFKNIYCLTLYNNDISDISELTDMNLIFLDLWSNKISTIDFLKNMPLRELDLSDNMINDINALEGMELRRLNLSKNQIEDISALKGMTSLRSLDLDNNKIKDISVLSGINPYSLNLSNNLITDISPLKGMTTEVLDVSYNSISDIGVLADMPLRYIYLNNNEISDISPLSDISSSAIDEIDLRYNKITDLSSIKGSKFAENLKKRSLATADSHFFICFYGNINYLYYKAYYFAEGNYISKQNAIDSLPEELLNYKVCKYNSNNSRWESTDYTWFDTEPFVDDSVVEAEKEKNVEDFVKRLYSFVLGRPADDNGIDSWKKALLAKESSGVDAGYGFVFSDECKDRNLSDEEFVKMLYLTFMNREADEGGKNAWISQLNAGVEREKILEGFIMSAEFGDICKQYGISVRKISDVAAFEDALGHYCNQNADLTKFVARCYTEALGRAYDPAGLEAWCRVIINQEDTPKAVAQSFIFSEEFVDKGLNNEEYVKVLYRTFMGREADEGGLTAWVAVLESGEEDRAKVLEGFSDSVEFAEILQSFGLNFI